MVVLQHQPRAIGRPVQQRVVADLGQQDLARGLVGGLVAELVADHHLVAHAGLVRDVGDLLAVGAPDRILLAHAGGLRQVAHDAVLHRHGEDLAAGADHRALAGGRERRLGDGAGRVLPLHAGFVAGLVQRDAQDARGAAFQADLLELPAGLVDDAPVAAIGAAHVPDGFPRQLAQRLGPGVEGEEVGRAVVAVRDEDDLVAHPDRIAVGRVDMRDLLPGLALGIEDPDRRRGAAAALAPAARARVGRAVGAVGQARAVGRPHAFIGDGLHHLLLEAAFQRHLEQLLAAGIQHLAVGGEQHAPAIGAPAGDLVRGRMPGQAPRLTAAGGDHVDIGVAVVTGGERDPLPVGREARREFGRGMTGQTARLAAVPVGDPQVAAVDEGQVARRDGGLAQQHRHGGRRSGDARGGRSGSSRGLLGLRGRRRDGGGQAQGQGGGLAEGAELHGLVGGERQRARIAP